MIDALLRPLLLRASRSRLLRERLPRLPGVRRGVRRFMPGETAAEALGAAEDVSARGGLPVLTLLGEDLEEEESAEEVRRHYRSVLAEAEQRGLRLELSVKPTQLGLELDEERAAGRLLSLAAACREAGSHLWLDMEGSRTTDRTLELYRRLRSEGDGVGVCLQAYLRRTPADLEALLPLRPAVRLVKGAYAEPAERALQDRGVVDRAFLSLGRRLLEASVDGGARVVLGTHDDRLVEHLGALARKGDRGLEVHMMYGVRTDLQERLARLPDVRLGVLVSYGPAWYAWYMRRLAERPANLLFALRQMVAGAGGR